MPNNFAHHLGLQFPLFFSRTFLSSVHLLPRSQLQLDRVVIFLMECVDHFVQQKWGFTEDAKDKGATTTLEAREAVLRTGQLRVHERCAWSVREREALHREAMRKTAEKRLLEDAVGTARAQRERNRQRVANKKDSRPKGRKRPAAGLAELFPGRSKSVAEKRRGGKASS